MDKHRVCRINSQYVIQFDLNYLQSSWEFISEYIKPFHLIQRETSLKMNITPF